MKNSLYKIMFIVVLFFGVFFNVDIVKAEDESGSCSCYYIWFSEANNADIKTENNYYAEIKFENSDEHTVKSCGFGYVANQDGSRDIALTGTKTCDGHIEIDKPNFKADNKGILKNNCSVDACNTAKIYITEESGGYAGSLTTEKNKKLLFNKAGQAQAGDIFEKAIEDNIDRTESADNTTDDISPDEVVANEEGINEASVGTNNCDIIPDSIIDFLNTLFLIIQVIGIILLVFMSMIEFIKALTAADDDGLRGAIKNTFRRIIIAILLLILPMFIIWILNIANANAYETNEFGKRVIGEDGNPLCK